MVPVKVSVTMGKRVVALESVRDARIAKGLEEAARGVAAAMEGILCPVHGKGPTDVRLHFDASGNGDLKYESCCDALGKLVAAKLG